ncbi:transposase [Burkholderia sp. 9775_39]|uniref:IS66 family transposase n=1 Tax=unclassified Burkholderia TaxID=2613784 RepID=UPI0018C35E5C|nr:MULTISPECIES: transposase [unclassified Burkholderia]MBG0881259.1 transposase [Burkholderia sp. 9775_39]MBG0887664.1 transposase [Burkholderia sp. 9773_38]
MALRGICSSTTAANSRGACSTCGQPEINLMRGALLRAKLIYCDETTFKILKERDSWPQTDSYPWPQMAGSETQIHCFAYTPERGAKPATNCSPASTEAAS